MSRLSFRPRPLDIQKRLPIVGSLSELDQEDAGASRSVSHSHIALDAENEEVLPTNNAKGIKEIPIPESTIVPTYDKDYLRNFVQPPSYIRGRPARGDQGEFVEYDLDEEDEDWLDQFNNERNLLSAEKFEEMLFKLEIAAAKFQERAGIGIGTPGAPLPSMESAYETLRQVLGQTRHAVISAVYDYWTSKREQWGKPILRRFQPPPAVTDTNPFNVFRPREKVHRPHTRRMQRRENDLQSFQKLQQVYKNMESARSLLSVLQKREETKREVAVCEAEGQKMQLRLKHDPRIAETDELHRGSHVVVRGEENGVDANGGYEKENGYGSGGDWRQRPSDVSIDGDMADALKLRKKKRRRLPQPRSRGTIRRVLGLAAVEPLEPVMLFAKPISLVQLQAAGIKVPPKLLGESGDGSVSCRGRFGRGGRIVFDRWPSLAQVSPRSDAPSRGLLQPSEKSHPPPPRLDVALTGLAVENGYPNTSTLVSEPGKPPQVYANGK